MLTSKKLQLWEKNVEQHRYSDRSDVFNFRKQIYYTLDSVCISKSALRIFCCCHLVCQELGKLRYLVCMCGAIEDKLVCPGCHEALVIEHLDCSLYIINDKNLVAVESYSSLKTTNMLGRKRSNHFCLKKRGKKWFASYKNIVTLLCKNLVTELP